MSRILLLVGLAIVVGAGDCAAVPDRAPRVEPPPEDYTLDKLPKNGAMLFGNWLVCKNVDENGIIIIHRKSKLAIYLPWASNGWVNYRTPDGTSYVLWSRGDADPQPRNYYLEKFLDQPSPGRLAPGKHKFQAWTVTVSADAIELHCSNMESRLVLRRDGSEFTHNGRTIGNGR